VGELTDIRYLQLARILGLPRDLDSEAVAEAARSRPEDLAGAFFAEAADSDDVIGGTSAVEFLEDRLTFFSGIIDRVTAATIRMSFHQRLSAWK
jgi:hypothetical protein